MNQQNEPSPMPVVQLAGKQVSRFGLGGFHQLEISSEVVADVIDAFLDAGGNYIETARGYGGGASEDKIGRALQGRRDRVILASKSGATSADDLRRNLDASLKALRTNRLDFYFFHGMSLDKLDRVTAPGGALEGMTSAMDEGLIGGVGMSSHELETYLAGFERLPLSVILIWCNYLDNLNFPIIPNQIIPAARRRGIGVTAMKPLADGFLHRSCRDAIRYCLGCGPQVAVCGTNSVQQVHEVASAVREGPADEADTARILRDAVELGRYVCRRCGQCPEVLMELFRLEGEFDRQMVDFLPRGPAETALRKVLSPWFSKDEVARKAFAATGAASDELISSAGGIRCPCGIDVARKARIAAAKLTGADPQLI